MPTATLTVCLGSLNNQTYANAGQEANLNTQFAYGRAASLSGMPWDKVRSMNVQFSRHDCPWQLNLWTVFLDAVSHPGVHGNRFVFWWSPAISSCAGVR